MYANKKIIESPPCIHSTTNLSIISIFHSTLANLVIREKSSPPEGCLTMTIHAIKSHSSTGWNLAAEGGQGR